MAAGSGGEEEGKMRARGCEGRDESDLEKNDDSHVAYVRLRAPPVLGLAHPVSDRPNRQDHAADSAVLRTRWRVGGS